MKANNIFTLIFLLAGAFVSAAPEVLTYSGRLTSSGTPYSGSAQFKFALVDRTGNFSYWSNHGQFSNPQEPSAFVTVPVNDGIYSVKLGDTSLQNMQVLSGSIFRDHNDAHLRIWVRLGSSGAFEMLSPDQPVTSVPYSLGGNGILAANPSSGGSVSNSSGGSTHSVSGPQSIGSATVGAYARLVANGPTQPSATLVLLTGDSADIVTYYADQPGRLEYAFGAHTFAFPKAGESLADQKTLVGPASVRLVAPTGTKNVAILQVKRADGRDPTKLEGAPAPPADGQNPVTSPPAIVSVPSSRSVARGGTTALFVSASGENLSYQWKKNGQNIAGATSSSLPLENATGADAGQYVVQVTNPNGTVSSQAITVTVKMPVVPAGVYRINNSAGNSGHEVALTSFSIDQHEVTKAFWDEVYSWAIANGYDFSNAGIAEGPEYPVHSINWYDCVKWANALSERDGHTPCYYTDNNCTVVYRSGQVDLTNYNVRWNANGYRLPTETEWEVAARGGLVGSKYAWGESPSTTRANFDQTLHGATIPVGSFPANGYGLYEIGGNLREWTWDWNDSRTYEYDFNETFESANGLNGLVEQNQTTAIYLKDIGAYVPGNPLVQIGKEIIRNNTNEESYKVFNFDLNQTIRQIKVSGRRMGSSSLMFKVVYTYQDNQTDSIFTNFGNTTYYETSLVNPNPDKFVKKIEVRTNNYGSFKNVVLYSNADLILESLNEVQTVTNIHGSSWLKAKELMLSSDFVSSVGIEIREQGGSSYDGNVEGKVEFYYTDGHESNSSLVSSYQNIYSLNYINNPKADKKVEKIVVYIRSTSQSNTAYLREVEVLSHLTSDLSYVTLKFPKYFDEKMEFVKVKFFNQIENWIYNEKDAFQFSIIDKNGTEVIFDYEQIERTINIVKWISNPEFLRVYLRAKNNPSSASGNALFGINFKTNNPKSHWTGTKRVIRDNHYAEALENLGKRSFSTPDRRFSTVGFRLVQRP